MTPGVSSCTRVSNVGSRNPITSTTVYCLSKHIASKQDRKQRQDWNAHAKQNAGVPHSGTPQCHPSVTANCLSFQKRSTCIPISKTVHINNGNKYKTTYIHICTCVQGRLYRKSSQCMQLNIQYKKNNNNKVPEVSVCLKQLLWINVSNGFIRTAVWTFHKLQLNYAKLESSCLKHRFSKLTGALSYQRQKSVTTSAWAIEKLFKYSFLHTNAICNTF